MNVWRRLTSVSPIRFGQSFLRYCPIVAVSLLAVTWGVAIRQRIAKSGGYFFRHRITPLNVCGNRQRPRAQVSVSRSGACRASASAPAR